MTRFTYGPLAVFTAGGPGQADTVLENATGGKFVTTFNGPAVTVYDFNDQALTSITSSPSGQAQFRVDDLAAGFVQFGTVMVAVTANEVGPLAQTAVNNAGAATAAAQSAASAAAAAQAAQAQVAAYIAAGGGGGGAGIDESTLTTILNNGTGIAARGVLDVLVGFRFRTLVGSAYTGAWTARPNLPFVISVGVAPKPTDQIGQDVFLEPASTN